jgi:hypothetical protein
MAMLADVGGVKYLFSQLRGMLAGWRAANSQRSASNHKGEFR